MREFQKEDWYGFAGAECAVDGRLPLINTEYGKSEAVIIVSEGSTDIILTDSDDNSICYVLKATYDAGEAIAEKVEKILLNAETAKDVGQVACKFGFVLL